METFRPIEEKKENNKTSLEKVKTSLSKAKKYILILAAAGYLGEGIAGFNKAGENIDFSTIDKSSESLAKLGVFYPVTETLEDMSDYLYEQGTNEENLLTYKKSVDYDFKQAFEEKKSLLQIGQEIEQSESVDSTISKNSDLHGEFAKMRSYMRARSMARQNDINDINAPIPSPDVIFMDTRDAQ